MPITTTRAKQIWDDLIAEYTLNMFGYFKKVRFNKDGKMKSNRAGAWVYFHFPNLIKEWKKRMKEMGEG